MFEKLFKLFNEEVIFFLFILKEVKEFLVIAITLAKELYLK
jgi:hypothetical protein